MILVDTSVWVDHLRRSDAHLVQVLDSGLALTHAFVIGELACGNLTDRVAILELLHDLPSAVAADADEVLVFIDRHGLHGLGIGYLDAHLLASVALTDGARLWTRDKRLHAVAQSLQRAYARAGSH